MSDGFAVKTLRYYEERTVVVDASKLKQMLKLGSHYKIERFGSLLLILTILLAALTGVGGFLYKTHEDDIFKSVVCYSSEFVSSLTETSGEIVNVFEDAKKTKIFLLLKFEDGAMTHVSTDTDKYRLLVAGVDRNLEKYESVKSNPKATLYMLGTSGYFGIMLHDAAGFPLQCLQVIVRMDRNLVGNTNVEVSSDLDSTFSQHDQFSFIINPGVTRKEVVSAPFLDEDRAPTALEIYALAQSDEDELNARQTLVNDLSAMQTAFDKIDEYTRRLKELDIEVDEAPEEIRGDHLEVYYNGQLLERSSREHYVYPEGHEKAGEIITPNSLELDYRLITDHVVPGGFDFDWYNGDIHSGYLDALRGDKSVGVYLRDMEQMQYETALSLDMKWYYSNGTEFIYDRSLEDSTLDAINAEITNLTQAWSDYYTLKIQYEREDLRQLLLLERNLTNIVAAFSVNADDSNLWLQK